MKCRGGFDLKSILQQAQVASNKVLGPAWGSAEKRGKKNTTTPHFSKDKNL
jgi:hypothetical protein